MPVHVYPPPGSSSARDNVRARRRRNNTHPPHTIKGQLAGWHADRDDRTFFRSMFPSWKTERSADDVIYNPFKLMAMVKPMDWLYFISGWFAWTVDGFDFFTVRCIEISH